MYYFDSFGVEIPPLFLEEYVDLGSNERIQQFDEHYCGAYWLYMIYLTDRGFRIKSDLNILVNQCKYPGIYNECFCLDCNDNINQGTCFADDNDKVIDKGNVNDNDNGNQGTCFADESDKDIDNDGVNDTVNDKDNDNVIVNDHDNVDDNANDNNNDNDIDKDYDLRSSFANNVNVKDNDNNNDKVNDMDIDNVNDNVNRKPASQMINL